MPRPSRAKSSGLTIGFLGTGVVETELLENLLIDFINAAGVPEDAPITFIIPITDDGFTETLGEVYQVGKDSDLVIEAVISGPASKAPKSIKSYIDDAAKSHNVEEVGAHVISLLADAPNPVMFVLFDADDEEAPAELEELILDAFEAGLTVHELTDGLAVLQPEGEDEPEEEPEEPEEETPVEPAKPARRSRAAAAPEPEEPTSSSGGFDFNAAATALSEAIEAIEAALDGLKVLRFQAQAGEPEEAPEEPKPATRRRAAAKPEPEEEAKPAPRRARTRAAAAPDPEPEEPKRSRGRPRADGTPAQPRVRSTSGRLVKRG